MVNMKNIMDLLGALKEEKIDWKSKKKAMNDFRDSFNRRIEENSSDRSR